MDYEEIYQPFKLKEKEANDNLQRQQTVLKSISKNAAKGDLKSLAKDINAMDALIEEYKTRIQELRDLTCDFDAQTYMENGDFAKQMLQYCDSMGVDVKGDYPVYEMFPFKVKIDANERDIYINGRRMPCVRPQYLVADINQKKEKLLKASFNAAAFLNELADAYDRLSDLKRRETQNTTRDLELLLKELYRFMTPMQRFRKDYDMQSFAFDLSRLYASDVEYTKNGRSYRLSPGRYSRDSIRILDKNGNESLVGTIIIYSKETGSEPEGK